MRTSAVLAAVIGAVFAAFAASFPSSDPDLFWHLQSGDWMLEHGQLLDRDVFSFTRAGAPYSVGQWLGEIALALAFRTLGWPGIALLRALLVGAAALFVARAVLRVQPHPGWAIVPILLALLVSRPFWGDRPQLFTLALFPVFLDVLLVTRGDGRVRRLAILPPLVVVWANLHGAFVLGIVLIAIFAVEAALARARLVRPLAIALGASLAAGLANPALADAYRSAGAYASGPARFIVEERPPDVLSGLGITFALLFGTALALALTRSDRAPQLLWALLVAPFALLGLAVQRQLPYAAFVIAPYVALEARARLRGDAFVPPRLPARTAAAALALVAAAAIAGSVIVAPREPDLAAYPAGAVPLLRGARVLNEYDWGGYLIRYAPSSPTFIDGRARAGVLFVPDVLADFDDAVSLRGRYREILDRWDIRAVLLRPGRPLAVALREARWIVRGEVPGRWVLLERPT